MSALPLISCLCPTYKRPKLLANAIACFIAQDYPADRRELVILDDAGQLPEWGEACDVEPRIFRHRIRVISTSFRFGSLPGKYNALAELACGDVFAVWEDDDIYLPAHLSRIASVLSGWAKPWSHSAEAGSLYTGKFATEPATGRFHAQLAMTRNAWRGVLGWPLTDAPNFDQQMLGKLRINYGPPAEPNPAAQPTYVFRWGSTGAYHGQAFSGDNWYEQVGDLPLPAEPVTELVPAFDPQTTSLFRDLGFSTDLPSLVLR